MKRFLFLLMVTAFAAYHTSQNNEFQAMLKGLRYQQLDQARISASRTSLGYLLREDSWIEFPLPQNIDRLKLITQASIPRTLAEEDTVFTYALEYQIIGENGESPMYRNRYHHTTRVSRFIDENAEEPYTASMYLDPELVPADGRILILNSRNWSGDQEAKSIRIRLVAAQQGLVDALLRIYQLNQYSQPEELANWQRLSIYKRERLARGNVYPHGYLSDQEKTNLLNHRWRPLGPIGVAGVDYQVRRLYTLKEVSDTPWVWQEQELAADIAPDRVMTFSTGLSGARLRLTFTRLPGIIYRKNDQVEMMWYGSSIDERDRKLIPMSNNARTITTASFTAGLLEFRAASPYLVDFEQRDGDDWVHWQPERLYTNTHLCSNSERVEFKIAHHESISTPIRVTLRAPLDGSETGNFPISYELLGSDNVADRLLVTTIPSLFDRIVSRGEELPVSDPSVYYLQVPAGFETIRFSSPRPILVSVATRSPNLTHRTRVPVDVGSYTRTDPDRISAWFSVQPAHYQERYKNQKTRLVFTQQRPPVDDPDLLLGNYYYESLRPSQNWTGRHLLLPPDPKTPLRAANPRSMYHLLHPGHSTQHLYSSDLLQILSPSLVYINNDDAPVSLTISVDGEHYFSGKLFGETGRLQLPPLAVGKHHLEIDAATDITLLINHLKRAEPGHMLRFATSMSNQDLTFEYRKTGTERDRLSFLFFSSSITEPSTIRVVLEGTDVYDSPVIHDQSTLTNRQFEISPTETASTSVLNAGNTRLGDGQRFLFPLGTDIPPGEYRIVVNLENGPGGYLVLSRVEPGSFSYRTLAKEPNTVETTNEPSS